jgi:hypothetical protein
MTDCNFVFRTMGNTEKLMNQIMELKFTSKSLQRQARKCEKEEKETKLKVKKAIEKGNMDGARIYAENAIRKRTEQMNYLRLSSRLDAVVARLDTQAKMQVSNEIYIFEIYYYTSKQGFLSLDITNLYSYLTMVYPLMAVGLVFGSI